MAICSKQLLLWLATLTMGTQTTLADESTRSRDLNTDTPCSNQVDMNYKVEVLWMVIPAPGCENFAFDYSQFGAFIHDGMVPGNFDSGMGVQETETLCVDQYNQDHIDEVPYTTEDDFQYRRQLSWEDKKKRRGLSSVSGMSLRARAMMRYFRLFKKCRFCFSDDWDQRRRRESEEAATMISRELVFDNLPGVHLYTDKDSYNVGEPITVGWYNVWYLAPGDWIAIYDISRIIDFWAIPAGSDQWVWACGDLSYPLGQTGCEFNSEDYSGQFRFGADIPANGIQNWPLPPGLYAAFLIPDVPAPYFAWKMTNVFEVKQDYFQNILALQQGELGVAMFEEANHFTKFQLGHQCYSESTFYPSVNFIPATQAQVDACVPADGLPDYFQDQQ